MSDELKPCPFCGGEAEYWNYEEERDVFDPVSLGWVDTRQVTVHCVGCESCKIVLGCRSKEEAVAAWNARAERTCRIEWRGQVFETESGIDYDGNYYCTSCNDDLPRWAEAAWDDYQAGIFKEPLPFRNCPNCGAKVVE